MFKGGGRFFPDTVYTVYLQIRTRLVGKQVHNHSLNYQKKIFYLRGLITLRIDTKYVGSP